MPWTHRTASRRGRVLAAAAGCLLLASCTWTGTSGTPPRSVSSESAPAGEGMPRAPRDEGAWLAAVDRIYGDVGGGMSAEQWLRLRMARRRPDERLAVLMGIDDVMLRTHFGGVDTLVPRSVRFARTAHALGYSVFYVTGRSAASGLEQVEATLQRSDVPANAFYGRPVGATSEEAAKAQCRASIVRQGYTLAVDVAASEASFDGRPLPEKEIRLPDFAVP